MTKVICHICKKEFKVKPNQVRRGWGKYCSVICRNESQRIGQNVNCSFCAKKIYKSPHSLLHSKSKLYFCDKHCQTRWRNREYVEEKSINWKNGIRTYRNILKRNKKTPKCLNCGISNEILLVVHHLDKNRQNNKVSNLIWLCHNCHYQVHHDKIAENKLQNKINFQNNSIISTQQSKRVSLN